MRVETIEQIKEFAEKHNMDMIRLEHMGFYIDYNTYTPKSYGIYREPATGEFVVYKNKADGTHVEHYRGFDEAYAVSCIMDKLNDAIGYNKRAGEQGNISGRSAKKTAIAIFSTSIIFIAVVWIVIIFALSNMTKQGYYTDDYGYIYYLLDDTMYAFDDYDYTWYPLSRYSIDDYDYYGSSYYFDDSDYDFSNTYYYEEYEESQNNYDDDSYDYDYDDSWDSDWDSGWDDWDSDW